MFKVDILSTIIQFPGHILQVLPKAVAEKTVQMFIDLFEKQNILFKKPLWNFNIINMVFNNYSSRPHGLSQ